METGYAMIKKSLVAFMLKLPILIPWPPRMMAVAFRFVKYWSHAIWITTATLMGLCLHRTCLGCWLSLDCLVIDRSQTANKTWNGWQ